MANSASPKKKTKRRMKKQVRKTIGALLMASAVVVAAIPVTETRAMVDYTHEPNKVYVEAKHPISAYASGEYKYDSTVPFVYDLKGTSRDSETTVYTSADGLFQFVYTQPTSTDPNKVAVILGYNGSETSLVIPDTLEGFKKYRDNDTNSGYCLVSKNGEFLHYQTTAQEEDSDGTLYYLVPDLKGNTSEYVDGKLRVSSKDSHLEYKDVNGTMELVYVEIKQRTVTPTADPAATPDPATGVIPVPTPYDEEYEVIHLIEPNNIVTYMPCYSTSESQAIWRTRDEADLYYSVDKTNFYKCGNDSQHQKINADVAYIGQEYLVDDGTGKWEVGGYITSHGSGIKDPDKGVFAFNPSLTNLTIGKNIKGIGDYAFYGCSTLKSVTFTAKLETVGNGAFAECINLKNCNIAPNANLLALGKDAFYNCRSLEVFGTNIGLRAIGDSCFEGCKNLNNVYLWGEQQYDETTDTYYIDESKHSEVALQIIGDHVFKDCVSLNKIVFPDSYSEKDALDFDIFSGCSSLQYIKISNSEITFDEIHSKDTATYQRCGDNDYKSVLKGLPDSFYIEGPNESKIHKVCKKDSIPFKYLNSDPELYEIKVFEQDITDGAGDKTAEVTYQIHTDGSIYKVDIKGNPVNLTIPENIGTSQINSIGEGAFNNNCYLTKITIPASCTTIGDNAFKGCHNLEVVTFTDASAITSIGSDAFKTQACMYSGTKNSMKCDACGKSLDYPIAKLTFCGAMINDVNEDTVPFAYAMSGVTNINNGDQSASWITYHSGWPTNMEVRYDYDSETREGIVKLVGYPRFEDYESVSQPYVNDGKVNDEYLKSLPYVTADNADYYGELISEAITKYKQYMVDKDPANSPNENQWTLINSALHIVVPSNVDAIMSGLFSGLDAQGNPAKDDDGNIIKPNETISSIVLNGVKELDAYTFAGCKSLNSVGVIGPEYIGDYCFKDDADLQSVTLGANLQDTGTRPFAGCTSLSIVDCLDGIFNYNDGIIYRNTSNGKELVECLEGRGSLIGSKTVGPKELSGVTNIKKEAFEDCKKIRGVDLSDTSIDVIPERCFFNSSVTEVTIATGTTQILDEAFQDTKDLGLVTMPYSITLIAQDAFANTETIPSFNDNSHKMDEVVVSCVENSIADKYAKSYVYLKPEYGEVKVSYLVTFYDYFQGTTNKLKSDWVNSGEDAIPPSDLPDHTDKGYDFTGWTEYTNITGTTDVYAQYEKIGDPYYTIRFFDYNGQQIGEDQVIQAGKNATPPADPTREGFTFTGWEPKNDYIGVYKNATIVAQYKDNSGDTSRHTVSFYSGYDKSLIGSVKVNHGESTLAPAAPTVAGYTFTGWVPSDLSKITDDMNVIAVYEKNVPGPNPQPTSSGSPKGSSSPSPSATANNGNKEGEKTKYTVSVSGGSGSGSYEAGAIVAINAYDMGEGQRFDKWTTSTAGVAFANPNNASTSFVMPAANVAITATYKTGGATNDGGSNNNGNGSGNNNGGNAGNNNGNSNNGTRVDINKGGISNTGVAGATVSGSTDNFVVKITDDASAASLAQTALQNAYGANFADIKYFPFDISLYDQSGTTKIADTSGMSVNITMPLPDELATYAGNNKVASVLGGELEPLNSRFTTVDGVPCINFTATHFSPYVIYVDTKNLTESTIDYTPKTGDPIHPKWFLAIGLACISLIMFFKKDKKVVVKAK